ncbi:unnamed protein product [Caenorhabditis auriculariae]|uniref:Store-operated calcium entry-associated regulatory factor n=1 Tax=Caenorhabditis auriculariae TaxID=2777116 RepID=A0A8S1HNH8_9PELO|nr:unnamed protein product [Caenorhabditis auriculariae]
MIRRIFYSLFLLFILFYTGECTKVKLTDISAITLHHGRMTEGRRSAPVPQLKCVGGTAKGAFLPKVVQCVNQGYDGLDVQWRCDADLPHDMEFGRISVSCEGYNYPEDPYVLKGSCGLEYELDYNSQSGKKYAVSDKTLESWDKTAVVIVVLFIAYIAYAMFSNRGNTGAEDPRRGGYGGGGGFDGGPGYPGGGGAPPPSYDDSMNHGKPPPYGFKQENFSQQHQQPGPSGASAGPSTSSGAGFWSGAALGALGGYVASRFAGGESTTTRNRRFMQDTGFMPTASPRYTSTSDSSELRSSSGFGGTSRR